MRHEMLTQRTLFASRNADSAYLFLPSRTIQKGYAESAFCDARLPMNRPCLIDLFRIRKTLAATKLYPTKVAKLSHVQQTASDAVLRPKTPLEKPHCRAGSSANNRALLNFEYLAG